MAQLKSEISYPFDKPGKYRIRVQGSLDQKWSERMGGLSIVSASVKDQQEPVTELIGQVRDQAALSGILNTLYELHMMLLSVEHLESD